MSLYKPRLSFLCGTQKIEKMSFFSLSYTMEVKANEPHWLSSFDKKYLS